MEVFKAAGYEPSQVTRIILTHRHSDHSGELRSFRDAKIFVSEEELGAAELQGLDNLVPVKFESGPYYNFPESEKIADGIYMIHGDIIYVDEALYENKLSVVYDDLAAARVTLDRVRTFIKDHPIVNFSTHTPQGVENLEANRVMDLDHPIETILAEVDSETEKKASGKYVCSICGYVYDPAENGGIAFEDLPEDWKCPRCRQGKEKFNAA